MTTSIAEPSTTDRIAEAKAMASRRAHRATETPTTATATPTDSDAAAQKFGAASFTADPGPAITATGRIYGINVTADAVAIHATATGNNASGVGVWGEAPLIGVQGKGGDDGAGVSGEGFFGVLGTLGGRKDGAAVKADGLGGVGVDAFGSKVAVRAQTNDPTGIAVDASGGQVGVRVSSAIAIQASGASIGVQAVGGVAVQASGVTAVSATGTSSTGIGVDASGQQHGVRAVSTSGAAVKATGTTGLIAEGEGASSVGVVATGATGLTATTTNPGGAGAIGHSPKGVGLRGISESGIGVEGASELGLGGYFSGTRAPIRLQAAEGGEGTPSGDHEVGELYVDGKANLYFCAAAGNPGVWKKIAMR